MSPWEAAASDGGDADVERTRSVEVAFAVDSVDSAAASADDDCAAVVDSVVVVVVVLGCSTMKTESAPVTVPVKEQVTASSAGWEAGQSDRKRKTWEKQVAHLGVWTQKLNGQRRWMRLRETHWKAIVHRS